MSDITFPHRIRSSLGAFAPKSFRAKFVLVVGAAVLFDLLLSGSIALWNVNRLSRDATHEIEQGLTKASQEYLQNYIETTALRADLLLDRVFSEVSALAGSMQMLIDHPETKAAIGKAIAADPTFVPPLSYDTKGEWAQNKPGAPSVMSVWGYLLGPDHKPRPDILSDIQQNAIFDVFGASLMATGAKKLQLYYVGPKDRPIMRTTPYSDQAQTFDKLYPGHNKANFWDFFFPGVYEDWQGWIGKPGARPVATDITTTAPYIDAITGNLIVSFFHPLWSKDRQHVAGMVAADITLEQLADIVQSVKLAETGFGFLTMSNGNVLAINPAGEKVLGLTTASGATGQGVTGTERSLRKSSQKTIASLEMPTNDETTIRHIFLQERGEQVPYIVVLRRLKPVNLWNGSGPIVAENLALGFVVPEREIYASLFAAQTKISSATTRIMQWQGGILVFSLMVVLAAVFGISKRITAGLSQLASAARRLRDKDYSVRVHIPSGDEVGEVGTAFNSMAEEIRYHTENLEQLVEQRTKQLGDANEEILKLNEKLKGENLRLGAELDIARQVQMMVLPKPGELDAIPRLDIASYMEPADEVGGDYYDVLQAGARVKIGIGDVTGHGLESGVLMLMVQSVARALQERGEDDPKNFLNVLNRAIYKNIERTESGKHLSLAFIDYADRQMTLSGQHEEVLIVRRNGEVERIDTIDLGFPVGLEFDISAFTATKDIRFDLGDVMILHTDGVTEAESPRGELFGLERLSDSAKRHAHGNADDIKRGIIDDLMAHIGTQKIHDDITLVVLKHR
ncbi:SpoIIE family protein phosphatase [Parvibaculum sp.]|uniref:SpoIIE family protein phosphatase n=1 Tax=Parvibaculum sp. TaxID=2024848 RepID=UPI002C23E0E8|nr:SpoIIE family protein phosphatase [Parvibaculum sp.]HUD51430.1 SpoIIE family protein phosphatase [Parvibaculum sp.]